MEKKTPLYQTHVDMGAKIVEFGGFMMPVQYPSGVIKEHMAVRTECGLFDVSHMGELHLKGPDAVANIQKLVTADIEPLVDGQVKYAIICNDEGGVVDDLVICRLAADDYLLIVNAGNRDKDAAWVEAHLFGDVDYKDEGDEWGELALQGPNSHKILAKICAEEDIPAKYYTFKNDVVIHLKDRDIKCLVSQTGYTGEHGYEIYCAAEDSVDLWNTLLEVGAEDGLIACGLGARDTLRLEASMPLYGHEMTDEITPKMAGLPCKLDGKDFIGRDALVAKGVPEIKRCGMVVVGRGIPREHCDIYTMEGEKIGWVSSGTHCPFIGKGVAMGYIPQAQIEIGKHLNVDVRGRMVEVEIVKMPFYKKA